MDFSVGLFGFGRVNYRCLRQLVFVLFVGFCIGFRLLVLQPDEILSNQLATRKPYLLVLSTVGTMVSLEVNRRNKITHMRSSVLLSASANCCDND